MGGKILRWATGAAILGGGLFLTDTLYFQFVHPNLPDRFTNWISANPVRTRAYQYGTLALGAMVLVPLAAGMVGLSAKSPLKAEASPLKA